MIELRKDQMMNQIEKARKNRCRVKPLGWRVYQVTTPEGKQYQVTFDVQAGRKLAGCECPAAEHERLCYHVAAAVQAHCILAAMRQQVEPICEEELAPAPAPRQYTDDEIDAIFDRARTRQPEPREIASQMAAAEAGRPAFGLVETINRAGGIKPSWRQLVAIKGLCTAAGLEAEQESQTRFGCNLEGLTIAEATRFITALQTAPAASETGILVKSQPASIGRVGGIEL